MHLVSRPVVLTSASCPLVVHGRSRRGLLVAVAAAVATSASPLLAASGVWTGAVSSPPATPVVQNWSDPLNWSAGAADGIDALADFSTLDLAEAAPGETYNVTLDTARTVGGLKFGDTNTATLGGYQITGANALTLQVTTGVPTITLNAMGAGRTARIDTVLTGTQGLNITGPGTLHLTNSASTYTGSTTLTDTNVRLGATNTFNGALLGVAGSTLTLQGNNTISNGNTLSGTMLIANNVVVPTGSTATFNLGNRSAVGNTGTGNGRSFTGGGNVIFNLQGNTSRNDFQTNFSAFTGNITIDAPTQVLGLDGTTMVSPVGRFIFNATGGGNFNGFNLANVTLANFAVLTSRTNGTGNTINFGSLSGTSSNSGFITPEAGGAAIYSVGGLNTNTSFAGLFVGNNIVQKVGTGVWTLTSAQFHTNSTNINAGTLKLDGAANLATSPTINIANAATFDISTAAGYATAAGQTVQSPAGAIGNIVGNYSHPDGTLSPGTAIAAGGLAFANDLSITGGSLSLQISPTLTPGGTNDLITVGGATSLGGAVTLNLGILGTATAGTYTLLQSTGLVSGSTGGWTVVYGGRGSAALQTTANALQAVITPAPPTSLIWTGVNSGAWDINTTANWKTTGGAPEKFFQGDNVLFDDSSTVAAVTLAVAAAPTSVVFNNSVTAYNVSGTGSIGGAATITKKGTATTILTTPNSHSGGTRIEAGVLDIGGTDTAIGTGTLTMAGGTLKLTKGNANTNWANNFVIESGTSTFDFSSGGTTARTVAQFGTFTGTGTLNLQTSDATLVKGVDFTGDMTGFSGTLNILNAVNLRTASLFGNPSLIVNLGTGSTLGSISATDKTVQIGQLTGTGTLRGHQSSGNGGTVTYAIGSLNTNVAFDGAIVDGAQAAAVKQVLITKVGTGTLTLNGTNTYTGRTTVQGGQLVLGLNAQQPVLGGATVTAPGGADLQAGKLVLKYDAATQAGLVAQVGAILDAGYDQAPAKFASGLLRSSTLPTNRLIGWVNNTASSQVEVAVTLPGDADLSFNVNFNDLLALAQNYNGSGKVWGQGDFDYTGTVDFNDLLSLAQNYNQSLSLSEQTILGGDFSADFALALSLVPEPTSLAALGLGATLLRRRRNG
jgi:fibronectin-binding autotransporter adhesin